MPPPSLPSQLPLKPSRGWMIHVAIVVGVIAAALLFGVLPQIRFHHISASSGSSGHNGSTYEGVISGKKVLTVALADSARRTPQWKPAESAPPISVERAVLIAGQTFPKLGVTPAEWRLDSVILGAADRTAAFLTKRTA